MSTASTEVSKAVWSVAYQNRLPDDAFMFVEHGGEQERVDGKTLTKPRSLRHFPIYDADGQLDLPHLRNAIARIPQASSEWLSDVDKKRLQEKARRLLTEATKGMYARAKGLPDWALEYTAHADEYEAAGVTGESVHKAWKGDAMVGRRSAEMLRSLLHGSAERVSKRVTKAVDKLLRAKVAAHNAVTPPPRFRVRVGMLKTAYQRGVAAYAKSRRPSVKSAAQWGFARVQAALSYCTTGMVHHPGYTEDFDFLPKAIHKDEMGSGELASGGRLAPDQGYRSTTFAGLPIVIDRPKGFVQRKTDNEGNLLWEREYKNDYGYIPSTLGGDSEELDVYLGPNEDAQNAYWIVQVDDDGEFDEYKVVLGVQDEDEARAIYLAHTPEKYLDRVFETPVSVLHCVLGLEPEDLLKAVEPSYYFMANEDGKVATAHPWTTLSMAGGDQDESSDAAAAPTRPLTLSAAAHTEMAMALGAIEKLLPPPRSQIATPLAPGAGAAPLNDETLVMLSAPDPFAMDVDTILTMAEDAPTALIEMPETTKNVAMLGKLGGVFKVTGVPGRVWVATYPLPAAAQSLITPLDPEMMTFAVDEVKAADGFQAVYDAAVASAEPVEDVDLAEMTPEAKQKRIDEAYAKYQDTVNMSASELEAWGKTECSKLASLDRSPIERNLRLLRKKKVDWDLADARDANRTVNFVSRMKGAEQGEPARSGCDSKRDISLRNWAYNPGKKSGALDDLTKAWEDEIQGEYEGEEEPVDKDALRGDHGRFAGSDGNNQHPTHLNQLGKFGQNGTSARDNRLQWAGMKAKEAGKPTYAIRDKKGDQNVTGGFKLSYAKPKKGEHYEIHPDGRIAHFKSVTPPDPEAVKVDDTLSTPPPVPAPGPVSVEGNPSAPPLPTTEPVGKAVAGTIVQFGKAEDERYTFGIVLVPDEPDLQGDVYDATTIRRAADIYMTKYQNIALQHNVKPGEIDEFHDENPNLFNGKILIVDSIVFPTDTVIAGRTVKAGTWCLGHRWVDDALWSAVKAGKYTGLSMGGFARRVALDATSPTTG